MDDADGKSPLDFDAWKESVTEGAPLQASSGEARAPENRSGAISRGEAEREGTPGEIVRLEPERWIAGKLVRVELPPGRIETIQYDPDTALESFFSGMAILCGIAGFMVFSIGMGGRRHPPRPEFLPWIPLPLSLAALFASLRMFTDNYYIVEPLRRAVDYRFSFLGFETRRTRFHAREVEAVVVECVEKSSRHSTWNEFSVRVFPKSGRPATVSPPSRDPYSANVAAFTLAGILGVPFGAGGDGLSWRRDRATGRVAARFWEDDRVGLRRFSPEFVLFAFALFGFFLLALLYAVNAR